MVLASTSAANAHQPRNAVRYADGTSSTIDTPEVLKFHKSTAIPDRASPWSAISLRSFCRLALVGCVAGDGCGPKLPSSTPSYPRSWSLCRMTWKSLVGLSWLNRYAQVPMDSRAFMESSLSRAVGNGATVLDGAAWGCQSCPRALRVVSSGSGGPQQGEKLTHSDPNPANPACLRPVLRHYWERTGPEERIKRYGQPQRGRGHDRTTCFDTAEV